MKKYLVALLLLAFVGATAQDGTLEDRIAQLQKKQDYGSALLLVDSLILQDPDNIDNYLLKAKLIQCTGVTESSLAVMEDMLSQAPPSAMLYLKYAIFLEKLGYDNSADKAFYLAHYICENDSQRIAVRYEHSILKCNHQDYKNAVKFLKECIEYAPNDYDYLLQMSHTLIVAGKNGKGLKYALRAIEVTPNNTKARNNAAMVYTFKGKYDKAIAMFEELIALEPKNYNRWNNLGYTLVQAGQIEKGISYIKFAIEGNPSNSYAYRNLGLAYLKLGDKQAACKQFETALRLGFTKDNGLEVEKLLKKHCGKK